MINSTQVAKSQWPCGLPKSTGNAFCIPPVTKQEVDQAAAKKKKNYDRYTQKLLNRGTSREEIQRRKAERVNPEASLAAFVPKSTRAPR